MGSDAHTRNLRKGRVSEIGRVYLVTSVTCGRMPIFTDFTAARHAVRELHACDDAGLCSTLAFVLMPDHLHWLVKLEQGTLSALVGRFKLRAASAVNLVHGTRGAPVWQAGFHDHAVRNDEDLREMARYIVANPVRAGLVRTSGAYPHWDAIWP